MIVSSEVEAGIKSLLFDYLNLKVTERLLLICHQDRLSLCEIVANYAREQGSLCTIMGSDSAFEVVARAFTAHDIITYFEETESTHSEEVLDYLATDPEPSQKIYRVFDFSEELFLEAFKTPKVEIQRITQGIIAQGWDSSVVTVKSELGTDLRIPLSKKFGWINSFGLPKNRQPGVLPPSEAATYSDGVNGILYGDGAINTNFSFSLDPRLGEHPVRIEIVDSRVVSAQCKSFMMNQFLRTYFSMANADRVGEIGFGSNVGLTRFVPFLSHLNERFPALHLGFGSQNQGPSRVDWSCPVHLDIILNQCEIFFDGKLLLQNHRYQVPDVVSDEMLRNIPMGYADTV